MKIYIATWGEDFNGRHLTIANITNRLTSYHKLREDRQFRENLAEYAKTGVIQPKRGTK